MKTKLNFAKEKYQFIKSLEDLKNKLNSKHAFLTRGEAYSLLNSKKNKTIKLKALKDEIVTPLEQEIYFVWHQSYLFL